MIRRTVIFLSLLIAAILLGLLLKGDVGYILISYYHWTIQMPIWFGIVALILGFITLYFLIRFLLFIGRLPQNYHAWLKSWHLKKAHTALEEGLLQIITGQFKAAVDTLSTSAEHSTIPMIHYMGAAFSAQAIYDEAKYKEYWNQAYAHSPSNKKWILDLLTAQTLAQAQQYTEALTLLKQIKASSVKSPAVLLELKEVYYTLQDWESLRRLLPQLVRYEVLTPKALQTLEIEIYNYLLSQNDKPFEIIKKLWKRTPRAFRTHPRILATYCRQLIKFKKEEDVFKLVTEHLKESWHYELVELFGLIKTVHPDQQLKKGIQWLKHHRKDVTLLIALARIATSFKYWIKAEEYFMTALSLHPQPAIYYELAQVYENLGDQEKAFEAYRYGLSLLKKEGDIQT